MDNKEYFAGIKIYTDGACSGNPGPGGWGAVLLYKDTIKRLQGGFAYTTNGRMELMGAIMALSALKRPCGVTLYTDAAKTIVDMLNAEAMLSVKVSYGTVVNELKEVSKSYKEAKMALDVGKIFYVEKNIIGYEKLGIGRLIYQLPVSLCRMFMNEIFGDNLPDKLDEETLITIQKFFENSLNVSETARQLYIHRNTLVYRIEKLQKDTGLDIRNFDDALTFKIALMVVSYLQYLDSRD